MTVPVAPGDVLADRYRVERLLGQGGMGVVVSAEHVQLGERVAVKFLLPEAAKAPDVVARFRREARAAARIRSVHVARVTDVGVLASGSPCLVMEYLEGQDLAQVLRERGPLPVVEAVGYVLQACIGVGEAHALGIVHRDIKPSNLFLARLPNRRSIVKVLDFGIAKHAGDAQAANLTSTFSALGSAAYMSPEQIRMAKGVDARTDVWSLGIVLFELLTGRVPFDGESVTAIAAAITADPAASLRALRPDAPVELEQALARCLEKRREQRIQSVAELAGQLAPFGGAAAGALAARAAEAVLSSTAASPTDASSPSSGSASAPLVGPIPARPPLASDPSLLAKTTPAAPPRTLLGVGLRSGPAQRSGAPPGLVSAAAPAAATVTTHRPWARTAFTRKSTLMWGAIGAGVTFGIVVLATIGVVGWRARHGQAAAEGSTAVGLASGHEAPSVVSAPPVASEGAARDADAGREREAVAAVGAAGSETGANVTAASGKGNKSSGGGKTWTGGASTKAANPSTTKPAPKPAAGGGTLINKTLSGQATGGTAKKKPFQH